MYALYAVYLGRSRPPESLLVTEDERDDVDVAEDGRCGSGCGSGEKETNKEVRGGKTSCP